MLVSLSLSDGVQTSITRSVCGRRLTEGQRGQEGQGGRQESSEEAEGSKRTAKVSRRLIRNLRRFVLMLSGDRGRGM